MNTRESSYFELFTTGVGYLNRVTEVTVQEGMPFLIVKSPDFAEKLVKSRRRISMRKYQVP